MDWKGPVFTALLEPAEEGGYVVTCPELPGLVTEGDTLEEAKESARYRNLTAWVRRGSGDGESPAPFAYGIHWPS
jgi:hypothetical protein